MVYKYLTHRTYISDIHVRKKVLQKYRTQRKFKLNCGRPSKLTKQATGRVFLTWYMHFWKIWWVEPGFKMRFLLGLVVVQYSF